MILLQAKTIVIPFFSKLQNIGIHICTCISQVNVLNYEISCKVSKKYNEYCFLFHPINLSTIL